MDKSLAEYYSSDDVTLRKVNDVDIDTLVAIINDAYSYQNEAKGVLRTNQEHLVKRISETEFYVIEKNKKLVGCVYLESHQESLHFGLLTIIPELRGTGLGLAIMNAIIKFAKSNQYKYLELDYMSVAPWLKKYYEKYGFKDTGEKTEWGAIDLRRMRLDIS